jgi:hypothetical protein
MRKKLEELLDKHCDNYRHSDSLHGETKEYVLDAMEESLRVHGNIKTLISDSYRDEDNRLVRTVDGKEINQIEEKTQSDIDKNEAINLWRMRRKS